MPGAASVRPPGSVSAPSTTKRGSRRRPSFDRGPNLKRVRWRAASVRIGPVVSAPRTTPAGPVGRDWMRHQST